MKNLKFLLGTLYKRFTSDSKFQQFSQEQTITFVLGGWIASTFHNFDFNAEGGLVDRFCASALSLYETYDDSCYDDIPCDCCDLEPKEIHVWLRQWSMKILIALHQHKSGKNYDNVLNGELLWKYDGDKLFEIMEKVMGVRFNYFDDKKEYVKIIK